MLMVCNYRKAHSRAKLRKEKAAPPILQEKWVSVVKLIYESVCNNKAGREKKAGLEKKEYDFDPKIKTLRQVLTYFTRVEVDKHNAKDENSFLLYTEEEQITNLAGEGKIGFDYKHNMKTVVPEEAVEKRCSVFPTDRFEFF